MSWQGSISRPAGAGGRHLLAHPEELQAGHARGRPDLRQREAAAADQGGPGARTGGQRRLPARHPARQPGHARHPLGLRLLHRRRLRHRSGGRWGNFSRRSRLRHQLRSATCPIQFVLPRRQARAAHAGRIAVPQRADRRRPLRALQVRPEGAAHILGEGPRYLLGPRPGDARRHRLHRGGGPARRRRPRQRQRPRPQPRGGAVRHARLRQSLPGSAGRRSRLRRGGRRRSWAWKRTWSA